MARKIDHKSIALHGVQERRTRKALPGCRLLHDYVNLYINARNPMMYRLKDDHRALCVLAIDTKILSETGVVVSDRNAARSNARFEPPDEGLALVDEQKVFAEFWTHSDDPIEEERHKGQMCAEVLVPGKVSQTLIKGAYVSCIESQDELRRLCPKLKTKIDQKLFFQK